MAFTVLPIPSPPPYPSVPVSWVRAEPFRAHLRHLMATTGLPWRVLSRLAGAEPREVQRLLQGSSDGRTVRRVRMALARQLYALDVETVDRARRRTVESTISVEALTRLSEAGWDASELSSRLRLSAGLLRALLEGRRAVCSLLVQSQILAAVEVLCETRDEVADELGDEPAGATARAGSEPDRQQAA